MPKRTLNQLVGGCDGWSIDPQYLKEPHEKLQNRQREWMKRPERRERKGKKKNEMERKGGASQSEKIRTCNKLHPPFHSIPPSPSQHKPANSEGLLLPFHFPPPLAKHRWTCLSYSSPHSPTHLPDHSLNSCMFQDRVVWGVKG